jgi:hypothetical protein
MEQHDSEPAEGPATGIADYYLGLCLVALVVMAWEISQLRGYGGGLVAGTTFAFGLVLLWFRWPAGPPLLLLAVTVVIMRQSDRDGMLAGLGRAPMLSNLLVHQIILCAVMFAYVVGFYRRLSMESTIFPTDRRKALSPADGKSVRLPAIRRDSAQGNVTEVLSLLLTIPACCFSAYLLWLVLNSVRSPADLGFDDGSGEWRMLLLLGIAALTGATGMTVYGYLERALATPGQSLLYLQDQVWLETRLEQSRANRFLFRTRLRGQRRKEKKS